MNIFILLFCATAVSGIFVPLARLPDVLLVGISWLLLAIFCRLSERDDRE